MAENGTFFNKMMIEGGFAKEYTYQDLQYKYQPDFMSAEKGAESIGLGMWGECEN